MPFHAYEKCDQVQSVSNMPEIVAAEYRLGRVEHPASTRSSLWIVHRIDNRNVACETSQHQSQHNSVAPRTGVPHIQHVSIRLCLQSRAVQVSKVMLMKFGQRG